jgi:hypothetical protein
VKKIITIFIIGLVALNGQAQTVLNGDFENTSLSNCESNLTNTAFTAYMPYCFAFGAGNEIDIWDSIVCPYQYSASAHSRRFISLHTNANPDALSLLIYPPLIEGNSYQLSYYEKAVVENYIVDTLDSLLITLSADSLHAGTSIYTSQPTEAGWIFKTVSFIAPGNLSYITFSNKGTAHGWNFIDDIQIGPLYIFTGSGNWTDPLNWSSNRIPPSILPAGATIIIDPLTEGTCVLDIPYTLAPNSSFIVNAGKSLLVK